ncbi:transcriptional regulator TrmB [Natrinema pellirubrum DSM 15624]|uniref:Transcriptional regulator n=1 Tax=Natrinema pellirubrum (strain DSM 15624 / CIP 106293 / JCM 10476 / NCIMB 786 / 157) TaxID=797303 RepID=L0JM33_NATP1|nr:helix-turn-helix domain-containing protein [Natrinema pellirubrum]AGB32600.1 putative transcriptional regulator [Natrinema pellirubrum DSM 15624]ELY73736.1 transcriptional regulator TrmB [Natrinema pellirubrum DSM 15624]
MTQDDITNEAVSLLQDLGLQEYEARCFLALTRLPSGTAKEIHEISEVPRTRVYDAIRVLESQGLVEVRHSSPQQFRAVGIDEATRTLRQKYDDRVDTLESYLETVEHRETESDDDRMQEVWSLTGRDAIESRTLDLLTEATSEIALVVADESLLSDPLYETLHDAVDQDVQVILGGRTDGITSRLETELPAARVFETNLDFLIGSGTDHEVAISRILLVDREALLIGSYYPNSEDSAEQAIFASGLENGIVVLLRRLISSGLTAVEDSEP